MRKLLFSLSALVVMSILSVNVSAQKKPQPPGLPPKFHALVPKPPIPPPPPPIPSSQVEMTPLKTQTPPPPPPKMPPPPPPPVPVNDRVIS